ncbi:helix-turn-helix domain-containing protein [Bradyrhizobium liaoningense]
MRQIRQMLRLARDGVSAREIGRTLGVARSTIQDNLKRASTDSGTTTPPRLGGRDERDSRVDLTTRGTLVPCIKTDIKTGMMPPPISGSR